MTDRAGVVVVAVAAAFWPFRSVAAPPRNVVMIVVDGMNDFADPPGGSSGVLADPELRARVTPNLSRLAAMGATFTRAFAPHTAGEASRAAVMTGVSRGGGATPLMAFPERLRRDHGYVIKSTGHLWRGDADRPTATQWDEVRPFKQDAAGPHRVEPQPWPIEERDGLALRWSKLVPTTDGRDDRSPIAEEELANSLDDQLAAVWAAEEIANRPRGARPMLLALGLSAPGLPWNAPIEFYERFPIDQITTPAAIDNDRDDLPAAAERMRARGVHSQLLEATPDSDLAWRSAIQAYLASCANADDALGDVLDAVERANSDFDPDNDWAIIFWSDHGFHLGEKQVWGAATPWEPASRTRLMLLAPGLTQPGQTVDTPVSLVDIGPTVFELAGAASPAAFQGQSLLRLIADPLAEPGAVAVTSVSDSDPSDDAATYAVRSRRFRLVHYADAAQELYDHENDPDELNNLLHPTNAEQATRFGLSPERIDALRRWHGARLIEHLVKTRAADGKPDPATIDATGDARFFSFDMDAAKAQPLGPRRVSPNDDFLVGLRAQVSPKTRSVSLWVTQSGGRHGYLLRLTAGDNGERIVRVLRLQDGRRQTLLQTPLSAEDSRSLNDGTVGLLLEHAAATQTLELWVQDRNGMNRFRQVVRLPEPIGADSTLAASRIDDGATPTKAAAAILVEPGAALPGDYSRDGVVNAADSTVWRDALGTDVAPGASADGDYDGQVDRDDQAVWRDNYGRRLAPTP